MGVLPQSLTPDIQVYQKTCNASKIQRSMKSSNYAVYVSYQGEVEKLLVTPDTDSEALTHTLLSICGISPFEDTTGICVTLWKSDTEQVVGELSENTFKTPYKILVSCTETAVDAAKSLDTLTKKIKSLV
jgi:hypothetical protein